MHLEDHRQEGKPVPPNPAIYPCLAKVVKGNPPFFRVKGGFCQSGGTPALARGSFVELKSAIRVLPCVNPMAMPGRSPQILSELSSG